MQLQKEEIFKKQIMQQKRLVLTLIILAALLTSLLPLTLTAFAQPLDNDDFDIVFFETTKELYDTQADELYLTANKEALLDMRLQPLGFAYDFTANGEQGYTIIIRLDGEITVAEFALGANSPFEGVNGNRVYAYYKTYLYENNGDYFACENGAKLAPEAVNALTDKGYKASGAITYSEEYVTYSEKSKYNKDLALRHPYISEVGGLSNACAPIAGANLIQYWDKFCENLIPDFTSYTILYNQCVYKGPETELQNLTRQLYKDMKTNVTGAGTTEDQFKNGLKTYCRRQGYNNVAFYNCMISGKLSFSFAKLRIDNGQPLALFVDTFTVANIWEGETDYIDYLVGNGCHVMAGFGYKEINYTLSDGTARTDNYIAVASGLSLYTQSYFNVYLNTIVDDAFGVVIS